MRAYECVCIFDIYAFCLRINMIAHTPAALSSRCSSTNSDNTNEFFGEECVSAFCVHQNETNNMANRTKAEWKKKTTHAHTSKIINRIFNAVARAPKRIFSQLFIIGGTHTNTTLETSAIRIWISFAPPCRVCEGKFYVATSMVCDCEYGCSIFCMNTLVASLKTFSRHHYDAVPMCCPEILFFHFHFQFFHHQTN